MICKPWCPAAVRYGTSTGTGTRMRSVHTRLLAVLLHVHVRTRTRACCVSSCWLPAALDWLRLFQNGGLREEQSRLVTTILWSALRLKGQSIFGWSSNYTADSVIRYAHVYVPRPDRASLSPLFWNNLNERSQSNAVAACRQLAVYVHCACMRVPVPVLVPYRTVPRQGTTV